MYSKSFILQPKLKILIDSLSVDSSFSTLAQRGKSLFKYYDSENLQMTRTPCEVKNAELKAITAFEKEYKHNNLHSIKTVRGKSTSKTAFSYRREQIEEISRVVMKKDKLSSAEQDSIELVFVHAALRWDQELNLLVTTNQTLLQNRLWFEGHFPGGHLNIMTPEEAAEIVDLYLKSRGRFFIACRYSVNKGYWYWLSFRLKVPFFNVGDQILDAFSQRFVFSSMSVDEMGFQFYSGVNNDTMDGILYHFNYFISLVSGIFDNLAIRTFNQYHLTFEGSNIPSRISLKNDLGRYFLRALREKNQDLRNHISKYVHFIKAIYLIRDTILHREGLKHACFEQRGEGGSWKSNFIEVPNEIVYLLRQCGDTNEEIEPWTRFGIYRFLNRTFMEPYKFAKSSIALLASFCSRYLELLEFDNFIEKIRKKSPEDDFVKTLTIFEQDNLGF